MAEKWIKKRIYIDGMTCIGCQNRIEKALRRLPGVSLVKVRYDGGYADISYAVHHITQKEIEESIEKTGYTVKKNSFSSSRSALSAHRTIGILVLIAALYLLFSQISLTSALPLAQEGMGYGVLFLIGGLTSFHCVIMCSGICLSQTMGHPLQSGLLYNMGRVISYTTVGFIVGALGNVITPSGVFKGGLQMIAGVCMVIMGINMLGIFPWLRKITLRFPVIKSHSRSPLIIGLLNGLMPCGPLQAMQIYALSTGSPIKGALSMFLFSLGTVPLMIGLGAMSSAMTRKFSHTVMSAGAVLVTVLGLTMFSQGTALSGFSPAGIYYALAGSSSTQADESHLEEGTQIVNSVLQSGSYPVITVKQGVPVKWTITAEKSAINGCNKSIYIPAYDLSYTFSPGENCIEFTPEEIGTFTYTCWMGMIRGTIIVVD